MLRDSLGSKVEKRVELKNRTRLNICRENMDRFVTLCLEERGCKVERYSDIVLQTRHGIKKYLILIGNQ